MTTVRITDLTAQAVVGEGNEIPLWDDVASLTKKATLANLRNSINSGAISTVDDANLTANRALASNGSGKIAVSAVTATELGYLSGVTAALQTQINALLGMAPKNLLRNGNFDFWDKGTAFDSTTTPVNNDATYLLPGWCLLSSGNDIVDVAQATATRPDGSRYYARFTLQGANTQFGIVQHLNAAQAIALKGKTVSLSFQARASGGITAINARVLAWTSTADSPTRDVVNAWGSPTTIVANYTSEGNIADQALSSSWQTFSINGAALSASLNNLAVFIWASTSGAGNPGDTLDIAQVQLEIAASATAFIPLPPVQDRKRCNEYYWRVTGDASGNGPQIAGRVGGAGEKSKYFIPFPAEMWKIPTPAVNGTWALSNCTGPTAEGVSAQGFNFTATGSASGAVTIAPDSTDDYIEFDAEL